MKKAGLRYTDVNTDEGFRVFEKGEEAALTVSGNYAVRVMYTNAAGDAAGVNFGFTYNG